MQTLTRFFKDALDVVDAVATGLLIGVLDAPIHNPLDDDAAPTRLDGQTVDITVALTAVHGDRTAPTPHAA